MVEVWVLWNFVKEVFYVNVVIEHTMTCLTDVRWVSCLNIPRCIQTVITAAAP